MRRSAAYALLPCAVLVAWQGWVLAARAAGGVATSPGDVLAGTAVLAMTGMPPGHRLPLHVAYSLWRVSVGFGAAVLVGVPLGLLSASSPTLNRMVRPLIDFLRPIPPLAWVPLAIAWFGIGVRAAGFIIFLGAVFPIVVSTCSGVSHVPRSFVEVARSFRARPHQVWLGVLVPAALPSILTGLRVALGVAWMTLVAAEFTDVRDGYGLGYMLMAARDLQRMDGVLAGMACIGLIGWALDLGLRQAGALVARS